MSSLRCIDEQLSVFGDWNTPSGKILILAFEKCDKTKRKTCKTDQEIKEYTKPKYFRFAYNAQEFNEDKFKEEKFDKSVRLDCITMDINTSYIKPYNIVR